MGRLLLFVVLILVAVLFVQQGLVRYGYFRDKSGQETKKSVESLLLPDLVVLPPRQLFIDTFQGKRYIKFSTTFINKGEGPLDLVGISDPEKSVVRATQKIKKTDGAFEEKEVGEFIFHSGHDHWHIENYAQFQLWSYKENKEKDKLLATTEKISMCIWDEEAYDLTLENASQAQRYPQCSGETQGMSVGWSDTYDATVEGQELNINSIPDGNYLVRSVINPDKKIQESDYSNNEVIIYIEISGNSLNVQQNP